MNWRDLVGYQPLDERAGTVYYFHVKNFHQTQKGNHVPADRFELGASVVECSLTEDVLIAHLSQLFRMFPKTNLSLEKAKTKIAFNTRRGAGNRQWDNHIFYGGDHNYDWPIIVAEHEGLFAIFTIPNFEIYGYTLEG